MKMAVFWVVAPSELAASIKIALMMETARMYEASVNFYQTTQCYNPENTHLQARRDLFTLRS
jgi:hypothetical protein